VGTLLVVDKATMEWERLEFARLKVRAPASDKAKVFESIMINDKVYHITLHEEMGEVECN